MEVFEIEWGSLMEIGMKMKRGWVFLGDEVQRRVRLGKERTLILEF